MKVDALLMRNGEMVLLQIIPPPFLYHECKHTENFKTEPTKI